MTTAAIIALEAEQRGVVFIIECKIDALIKRHQRPAVGASEKDYFFSIGGYGAGILNRYSHFKDRSYILLSQRDEPIGNPYPEKLACRAKTWRDVLKCGSPGSTLVQDFLESLGQFNVRCCRGKNSTMTQKMHLIPFAIDACRISALLECVAKQSGVSPKTEDDTYLSTLKEGYVGRYFVRKGASDKWIRFVGGENPALSWFGYGAYAKGSVNVGFYCGADRVMKVKETLEQIKAQGDKVAVDEDYVWIESNGESSEGDQEWFIQTYSRIENSL